MISVAEKLTSLPVVYFWFSSHDVKRFVFLLVVSATLPHAADALSYFLSNSGSDSNSGTSAAEPWLTIAHLNTVSLLPGDSVLFERGGLFRGEIVIAASGTEDELIYIGAYGSGDSPVISGALPVAGWSLYSGNTYFAPYAQPARHLFFNDRRMTVARHPNSSYLFQQGAIGNNGFADSLLTQSENFWKSALVHLRTGNQRWEITTVDSSAPGEILCSSAFSNAVTAGYGYYFDGLLTLLDTAGEWVFDPASANIYFYAPDGSDPSSALVEASAYFHGVSIQDSAAYITIEGLHFTKQVIAGAYIVDGSHHAVVHNCVFDSEGERAIQIENAHDVTCSENLISDCLAEGIRIVSGRSCFAESNTLKRIGIIPGQGINAGVNGYAVVTDISSQIQISSNTIDSTGNGGISLAADSCTVEKNVFCHSFLTMNEAAVIQQGSGPHRANIIEDNFIFASTGSNEATPNNPLLVHGISVGDSCDGCFITHNTIAEVSAIGIYLNDAPSLITVNRNLVYGCGISQLKIEDTDSVPAAAENAVHLNQLFAIHEDQHVLTLHSRLLNFIPASFDFNYYFNPYDYAPVSVLVEDTFGIWEFRFSLPQWQAHSEQDLNSMDAFLYRNRFTVIDSLGPELITNGQFTNNFDGWTTEPGGSIQFLLDNSTPLDYGCLKLIKSDSVPLREEGVYSAQFAVDSGMTYQVRVSNYSMRSGNLRLYAASNDPPFDGDGLNRYFPFSESRNNYQTVFEAIRTDEHARLQLLINHLDSLVWVDNVSIAPVTAAFHDPKKLSRLFVNPTPAEVSFDLGDSLFFHPEQNPVSGSFSLLPYSSAVLIFDSALITTAYVPEEHSPFRLFPNPARRGSQVIIELKTDTRETAKVRLLNMFGVATTIVEVLQTGPVISFQLPSSLSPGVYLVEVNGREGRHAAKLLVAE